MTIWANPTHSIGAKFGDYSLLLGDDIIGRNKVTDYFYRLWCNLSRDGYKPTRADVRPASMKQYLDRLVLMDVQPNDQAFGLTVKLIGSHVAAFYGEIAGKDIREMDNEDAIKRIYNSSAKVIDTGQPALSVTAGISKSKEHLEGFALYMPLFCEEGRIHKIMVSVDIKSLIK